MNERREEERTAPSGEEGRAAAEGDAAPGAASGGETPETPPAAPGGGHEPAEGGAGGEAGLLERLAASEQQAREHYDRLLRVSAEFENFKKRQAREMDELRKYANRSLLREMLSVVDHIEMALQSAEDKTPGDPLKQGLALTLRELQRVLEKFHVTPVEAEGRPFNPEYHEAILREESAAVPPNTVLRVLQKGYLLHDRLLRPALVAVSAAAAEPPAAGEGAGESEPAKGRARPPA